MVGAQVRWEYKQTEWLLDPVSQVAFALYAESEKNKIVWIF